jgi:hypothetical protein
MLNTGQRVKRLGCDDYYDTLGTVGTVMKCSQFGYVTVMWDNGIQDRYPPMLVGQRIIEVTGDDALPRHMWDLDIDENPPCLRCRVIQTDENELGPCRGEHNG